MSSYLFKELRYEDLKFINNLPEGSVLVFKNTKGLDKEIIRQINPKIVIRIIGGLDEVEKPKYNSKKYYDRTLYKPIEVYKIIEKMESIEKNYKPDWTDLDIAMYVYKQMCDNIVYDHVDVAYNGRDLNRNLLGFLTGKSVCAGFSMMYKEMMERSGIRCIYQNKQHGHAWNLIEINGRMIPVDLTFDVGQKEMDGKCSFSYFGRNKYFFNDPNHIATDEKIYPTSLLSDREFDEAYEKVIEVRDNEKPANSYINNRGEIIYYYIIPDGEFKRVILNKNGIMKTVIYDETVREEDVIKYNYFAYNDDSFYYTHDKKKAKAMIQSNLNCKIFYRKDGSSFMLRTDGSLYKGVIEHDYITFENKVKINRLLSEDNLVKAPEGLNDGIANLLLTRERVNEKVKRFKGYVGYIGLERGRYQKYYNAQNEMRISGVVR